MHQPVEDQPVGLHVSVPFNAGRGLMRQVAADRRVSRRVSVPFNAGRGLMPTLPCGRIRPGRSFSTLQCGSWIDA